MIYTGIQEQAISHVTLLSSSSNLLVPSREVETAVMYDCSHLWVITKCIGPLSIHTFPTAYPGPGHEAPVLTGMPRHPSPLPPLPAIQIVNQGTPKPSK